MKNRHYMCGIDSTGNIIEEYAPECYAPVGCKFSDLHHEPDCTGWNWTKPIPPVIPDVGEGYRLIDKAVDKPQFGDEVWQSDTSKWSLRIVPDAMYSKRDTTFYRRKKVLVAYTSNAEMIDAQNVKLRESTEETVISILKQIRDALLNDITVIVKD